MCHAYFAAACHVVDLILVAGHDVRVDHPVMVVDGKRVLPNFMFSSKDMKSAFNPRSWYAPTMRLLTKGGREEVVTHASSLPHHKSSTTHARPASD